jgi:hypothetical protein
MDARAQADVDHAAEAERIALGPRLEGLIRDEITPRLQGEQFRARTLVASLPPLPPPGVQHPGDPATANWTNTGKDMIPPGIGR